MKRRRIQVPDATEITKETVFEHMKGILCRNIIEKLIDNIPRVYMPDLNHNNKNQNNNINTKNVILDPPEILPARYYPLRIVEYPIVYVSREDQIRNAGKKDITWLP